jgi:hypothetical protein
MVRTARSRVQIPPEHAALLIKFIEDNPGCLIADITRYLPFATWQVKRYVYRLRRDGLIHIEVTPLVGGDRHKFKQLYMVVVANGSPQLPPSQR